MTGDEAELRKRVPWRFVIPAIVVVGAGLAVLTVAKSRGADRRRVEAARQLLAVLDHDYQQCLLGVAVNDGEVGKRLEIAGLSGQLTYAKVRACGELAYAARDELKPLRDDHPDLKDFWREDALNPAAPPDFGVCKHIAWARAVAHDLYGLDAPAPGCNEQLPPLAVTVQGGDQKVVRTMVHDGELIEDRWEDTSQMDARLVRRTHDGKTWETSPALSTRLDLHFGNGVFGLTRDDKDVLRYAVLDGDAWHVGANVIEGSVPIAVRHTKAGWTLLQLRDETPTVVRLDDKMDAVRGTTPIPALHGRWSGAPRVGLVNDDGSVVAYAVHPDDHKHLVVEAHRVPSVSPMPPSVLTLDSSATDVSAFHCQSYLVLPGVAVVYAGDASLEPLLGGEHVEATRVDCTADHFFAAGERTFSSCDHEQCVTTPLPVMADQAFRLDVSPHGAGAQVLLRYRNYAVLFDADPATAKLTYSKGWSVDASDVDGASILLDGTWFTFPVDPTPGF